MKETTFGKFTADMCHKCTNWNIPVNATVTQLIKSARTSTPGQKSCFKGLGSSQWFRLTDDRKRGGCQMCHTWKNSRALSMCSEDSNSEIKWYAGLEIF